MSEILPIPPLKAAAELANKSANRLFSPRPSKITLPRVLGGALGVVSLGLIASMLISRSQQANATDQISRLNADVASRDKAIADLQAQLAAVKSDLESMNTKLVQSSQSLDESKNQLDKQQSQADQLANLAQQQLVSEESRRRQVEADRSDVLKKGNDLHSQLQQALANAKNLDQQLQKERVAHAADQKAAEKKQADLQKSVQTDEDQLKKDKAAADKVQKDAKERDDQLKASDAKQIKELQDQLKHEKDELDKANQKIKNLEAQHRHIIKQQ